mgnify:CR=1 FL=1
MGKDALILSPSGNGQSKIRKHLREEGKGLGFEVMQGKRMVIFGCGYVGRALAEAALEEGCEVWIQSRNAASLEAVAGVPEACRVVGNLHEREWHGKLPGDWDYAVNLVSSAGGGLEGYRISYLEGNRSIREWARQGRVGRFLYTSATSVYPQSGGEWVDEDDVPGKEQLSSSGALLRQSELELLGSDVFAEVVIARLAGIYGPGRHLYLNSLREGADAIPGDGSSWLNLIYLKDIVGALKRLLKAPMEEQKAVYNVVDDEPSKKKEIVDWLATKLGMRPIPFDPTRKGARAARRVSGGKLPNRRVSNRRVKEVTGWAPAYPNFRMGYEDLLDPTGQARRSQDRSVT